MSTVIQVGDRKQLFLDDYGIETMSGIVRTLHQPRKCGPVLRPDTSRGQYAVQSRNTPQWNAEKQLWEWWYWGSYRVAPHGRYHDTEMPLVHYAQSEDGLHWETPDLGLFEWRGTRRNNIAVDPQLGDKGLYHILRDEEDPDPTRRYKGLFDCRCRFPAVSPDGFAWTMLDIPKILSCDESQFVYDPQSRQFLATVKQGTQFWGRSVWLTTSRDFVNWSELRLTFHADETDRANRKERVQAVVADPAYLSPPIVDETDFIAEVYNMAVLPYEGIYLGFPVLFNPAGAIPPPQLNFTAINQIELATSRDLYNWTRVANREVFLPIEPWDGTNYATAQVLPSGAPIVRGDEIWVYYNALRFRGHRELFKNMDPAFFEDQNALCLAKMRLDGFVSLDAKEEGRLVTKPLVLSEGKLHVNVDASYGALRAEILDAETLETLDGFSVAENVPITGDHIRVALSWRGKGVLPRTHRKPVRLRFVLRKAQLYAFSVAP
ncbi:MAG: hypothetical protein V1800_09585 [Candidatus Latescibacterota bacterium]